MTSSRRRGPCDLFALVGGCLAAGLVLFACDRPCDSLQKRLEDCAASEPLAKTYRDPRVREALERRCRRATPDRVKACLSIMKCDELSACAARAIAGPAEAR
jgi:hypothetical protein